MARDKRSVTCFPASVEGVHNTAVVLAKHNYPRICGRDLRQKAGRLVSRPVIDQYDSDRRIALPLDAAHSLFERRSRVVDGYNDVDVWAGHVSPWRAAGSGKFAAINRLYPHNLSQMR